MRGGQTGTVGGGSGGRCCHHGGRMSGTVAVQQGDRGNDGVGRQVAATPVK